MDCGNVVNDFFAGSYNHMDRRSWRSIEPNVVCTSAVIKCCYPTLLEMCQEAICPM